ncbi:MAG: hypothetical protein EOO15_20745 [Chitinophagaceae bacterium]|nr:MAG: hypothetical protein EOO15_20745 [Chitinophagaceae bacterium]
MEALVNRLRSAARLMVPLLLLLATTGYAEPVADTSSKVVKAQLLATIDFIDAGVNSLNAVNSLLKKEAYRVKITSFNNPASSDLGFNLEQEVQVALKPLLDKARNADPQKFSSVVSSLLGNGAQQFANLAPVQSVFPTILGLVSNLTISERRINRSDLDSFQATVGRYFIQFQKLQTANAQFDGNIDRLNSRMHDLQFDLREYLLDLCDLLYPEVPRSTLRSLGDEELLLRYLSRDKLAARWKTKSAPARYPSDALKAAKDLSGNLQKLFTDYQKVYAENYQQVRAILNETRQLGKRVNLQQVDLSLKEVELLYTESRSTDALALRLGTLQERLRLLSASEQPHP